MAMAFGCSASRSAAGDAFSSYDLGSSLGYRLVKVRGKRFVELEGLAFDAERFTYRRTSSLLDSPRSASPEYTPDVLEHAPLTPLLQRAGSPDYSPATPEYTPLTPSSQRSGCPVYSPATPDYTPLTPSSQRSGWPDYSPATTPEYTPLTPSSQRPGSPDYSPATPEYTPLTPKKRSGSPASFNDFDRHCISPSTAYSSRAPASPEYTPASPSGCCSPDYSMLFDDIKDFCYTSPTSVGYPLLAASPEYTPATSEYTPLAPLSPFQCASSPDYTPSSPSVSDAVSRTSPPSHCRHHPYQRSRTSCCQRRHSSSQNGY